MGWTLLGTGHDRAGLSCHWMFTAYLVAPFLCFLCLQAGDSLGDGGSVLDFMSMKSYSDVSLDISMLSSLGKFCWAHASLVTLQSDHQAQLKGSGP